jgi:hypothetical protein
VEFAALLPLLATLFVVTVDFGRLFFYQITIENCARNGAHFLSYLRSYQETKTGCVQPYDTVTKVILADGASLNPPLASQNITITNGTGSDGNPNVQVTIQYPFQNITNYPGLSKINLQASIKMRVAP